MEKEYIIDIQKRNFGTVGTTYDVNVLNQNRQLLASRIDIPDVETLKFVSQFFADEVSRITNLRRLTV